MIGPPFRTVAFGLAHALLVACSSAASADDGDAACKGSLEAGREVFSEAQPACAVCHTLQDAGAKGTVGPSLDELKPDAARVTRAVRKGVGVMPPYEGKLTEEQIDALAAYIARATGAGQ